MLPHRPRSPAVARYRSFTDRIRAFDRFRLHGAL